MAGRPRVIAYKFLCDGRVGPFSGVTWPAPGEWLHAAGGDRACSARVHACRVEDLADWMSDELWRVELDGDVRIDCGKLVAERGRLVERVAAWDTELMIAFAHACTLRTRDAALTLLAPGPDRDALAAGTTAEQVAAAAAQVADALGDDAARAVAYAGDTARHVLGAIAAPATAPMHAAVNGFIAACAAAFADNDLAAVERERAWQTAWIAAHAGLEP